MQLLASHLAQVRETRLGVLRARRIESVGGADLVLLVPDRPGDDARVRAIPTERGLDGLVACHPRAVQV